jgi:hypothetical protein
MPEVQTAAVPGMGENLGELNSQALLKKTGTPGLA